MGRKGYVTLIYYEPTLVIGIGDTGFTRMIFKRKFKL
jgi:hypothetical protein